MAKSHHDYDALPTDAHAPPFRKEMRVVATVIIFILLLEVIARIIAPHLDYDREHIHRFPEIIENLEQHAKESAKPRVVFFGNSLMMHGLKEEIFHDELKKLNGSSGTTSFETCKITPVGTAMLDWVYLYRRYFESEGSHPDILVVGFVRHHIHDQEAIKLRRLSRHFVAGHDLPDLWDKEQLDFHNITQSSLCNISALEGDQPEHQLGILYSMVPEYQEGVKANNRMVAEGKKQKAKAMGIAPAAEPEESFHRMTRFIETCKHHGVKIIFVPMPQPEVWDFNPDAAELAKNNGMDVYDARQIDGMQESDFSDGYHLGESGADKFSRWLARKMQQIPGPSGVAR
ncbi:hypothetical protein HW115_04100 [Verrucomicrobiaceae bacterium N1E253]|uniref:SGNH/GDSL hydrolase family protein n=1 Tax=Oceaniferula marina TaxID=2748318 RepID=A0A851GI17_9BACT|nr:hypothetical protein [Oceaniferula marina]NWK54777.1 hypothetical protein [Oceaniferula marina]